MPILLDTCAAIWMAEDQLEDAAAAALDDAVARDELVHLSMITAWEVGLLIARGRIASSLHPLVWFRRLTSTPQMAVVELGAEVLIASSYLPDCRLRDPADRIIVATARENALTIMTRDKLILDYAAAGHVLAMEC